MACDAHVDADAGSDAGTRFDGGRMDAGPRRDAGQDSGLDATAPDSGVDGGPDAGPDSGPPICLESPCRLVAPQCGCEPGQQCTINDSIEIVCMPDSVGDEGETCTDRRCASGLVCGEGAAFDVCMHFCNDDGDCVSGPGSLCIVDFGNNVKACTVGCDPVANTGCPTGGGCTVLLLSAGSAIAFTNCRPVGTGSAGDACANEEGCLGGHACLPVGVGGARQCVAWCRTHEDCEIDELCNPLRQVGTETYGYCF